MAKMNQTFDAKKVEPSGTYDILPEGWYTAQIEKTEVKKTKAGTGSYVSVMFKIVDGEKKGRTIFTNLNLDNPNPVAVEIAERQFSAICHAVGVLVVEDTEQLHGRPLEIKVGITPAEGKYDTSNNVKGYRPLEGTPSFVNEDRTSDAEATPDDGGDEDDVPDWLKE